MHESISIYLNKLYHYSILCDAPLDVAICHTISHEYIHSALFHIGEEKASKAFDNIADIKDWRTRTGAGLPLWHFTTESLYSTKNKGITMDIDKELRKQLKRRALILKKRMDEDKERAYKNLVRGR